ncbi:putative reverse transcriptase domain-containing protein [Tanacetum coccineum]
MSKGVKVLKYILSHKEKLEKAASSVKLSEECSAVIKRSLPRKEEDLRSLTLPCLIGPLAVKNALDDLGASINLMSHSLFRRLGISKLKPTRMSVQLADRSNIPSGFGDGRRRISSDHLGMALPRATARGCKSNVTPWVSPVQVVPRKGWMIVVKNEKKLLDDLERSIIVSWMDSRGTSKFLLPQKIKRKLRLPVHMAPSRTKECPSDYAMPQPLFSAAMGGIFHEQIEDKHAEVSGSGIEVDKAKIESISKLPYPTNVKAIRSFLGHACLYRRSLCLTISLRKARCKAMTNKEDFIPEEQLMTVSDKGNEQWYADYDNYLAGRVLPFRSTKQEKQNLFNDLRHYFWDEPFLFKQMLSATISYRSMRRWKRGKLILRDNVTMAHQEGTMVSPNCDGKSSKPVSTGPNIFRDINELDELRLDANESSISYKERTKRWHDKRIKTQTKYKKGDKVLLFNSRLRLFLRKLKSRWYGPFAVSKDMKNGAIELYDEDGNEFISSVEDLVLIPSESEDTPDSDEECDLPFCDNSVTFSNPLINDNDDFTSINDELPLEEDDIEYKDSYVSNLDEPALLVTPLSNANEDECFDPRGDIDEINAFLDIDVSTDIEDGYHDSDRDLIYLESLLNNDTNPYLPPGVFLDHNPRSLDEPDKDDLKNIVKVFDPGIWEKIISPTYVRLSFKDRHYLSLTFVIRIFLPYLTYSMDYSFLLSSESEDTIFDPSIFIFSCYSLEPMVSHRSGTFMCFNVYLNILNESSMEIFSFTCFVPNITMIWGESS